MQLRHEMKHRISFSDMLILRQRLRTVLKPDTHTVGGKYKIRSLYFDTPSDKALREKLDGVKYREKFRIRLYNGDTSLIHLEKKTKIGELGYKESDTLTKEEVEAILCGDFEFMKNGSRPLLCELYSKMMYDGLRPKTIVDYTREPFVFTPGNVRVTLDYNIRTGLYRTDLLNMSLPTIPIADNPVILEVKWDDFLPDIVRDAVNIDGRRTQAFSKYAACRSYDFI